MTGTAFTCWRMLLFALVGSAYAEETIYCGGQNCYDVLGITEKAKPSDIKKAYRTLSMEWHPDKSTHADAVNRFAVIGHAYGILSDEEQRRDYDYALKYPERKAYNQARYYYGQYYRKNVKVNPFLVIAVVLLSFSAIQYVSMKFTYDAALARCRESHKYKMALKQLKLEKLEDMEREKGKSTNKPVPSGKRNKKDLDAVEVDESVLIDRMNIVGGGRKPAITDLVFIQVFLLPIYLVKLVSWELKWYYKYSVRKEAYDDDAKAYLTRAVIGMSPSYWDGLEDKKRSEILGQELWVPENRRKWSDKQKMSWD